MINSGHIRASTLAPSTAGRSDSSRATVQRATGAIMRLLRSDGGANRTASSYASGGTAATSDDALSLQIIDTRQGFDALEAQWNALFARAGRSAHVFQTFNWNWHWVDTYLGADCARRLAVVVARRKGRLVMVWPLVMERSAGLKVATFMGAPVTQYGDVLVEPGPLQLHTLFAGWDFIKARLSPDVVRFPKTRADATVMPLLTAIGAVVTQRQSAPYLDLTSAPTYAAYETRYPSKVLKNRRRLLRRLEETGAVAVETPECGPAAMAYAATAIAMKRRWLDARGLVSPALADDRFLKFFASVVSGTRPAGVEISALTRDGRPAAMEISVACRDRFAIHVLAYDLEFDKFGPGGLLMEAMIDKRLQAGAAVYDLMAPGGGYKDDWADGTVEVNCYAIGLTTFGKAYTQAWQGWLRPRAKMAVERLPKAWRRRIATVIGGRSRRTTQESSAL